jgi:hypothetical protein
MVSDVFLSRCLMLLNDAPLASIRINLTRNTYPAGKERAWVMRLSSSCWLLLSTTETLVTLI